MKWWSNGNDLALMEAARRHARERDGGFSGPTHEALNSHLIGLARVIGMSENAIREAFASDRCLTIYEP
jgi:hypothetical protein